MRPARDFRYVVPTREDVVARLEFLLEGEVLRSEVANWASEYVVYDDPRLYPEVSDPIVWEALKNLAGADLPSTDGEFLHGEDDLANWLARVRAA